MCKRFNLRPLTANVIRRHVMLKMSFERLKELWIELLSPEYKVNSFTLYAAVVYEGASMGETRCWPGYLDPKKSCWLFITVERLRLILSMRQVCILYVKKQLTHEILSCNFKLTKPESNHSYLFKKSSNNTTECPDFLRRSILLRKKGDGPCNGFAYLSIVSYPLDLTTWSQRGLLYSNFPSSGSPLFEVVSRLLLKAN